MNKLTNASPLLSSSRNPHEDLSGEVKEEIDPYGNDWPKDNPTKYLKQRLALFLEKSFFLDFVSFKILIDRWHIPLRVIYRCFYRSNAELELLYALYSAPTRLASLTIA